MSQFHPSPECRALTVLLRACAHGECIVTQEPEETSTKRARGSGRHDQATVPQPHSTSDEGDRLGGRRGCRSTTSLQPLRHNLPKVGHLVWAIRFDGSVDGARFSGDYAFAQEESLSRLCIPVVSRNKGGHTPRSTHTRRVRRLAMKHAQASGGKGTQPRCGTCTYRNNRDMSGRSPEAMVKT